ncbi:hypothetical protein GCM10027059_40130 [Myceligenerans halotolerans]
MVDSPYEAAGIEVRGVEAVARALGYVHLGWAMVGWALALPVVRHFAQLCADAFGAGPRPARAYDDAATPTGGPCRAAGKPKSASGSGELEVVGSPWRATAGQVRWRPSQGMVGYCQRALKMPTHLR